MKVSVVYANPARPTLIPVEVPDGTTVEEVIAHSGILKRFPDIDLAKQKVGVFAKIVKLNAAVEEGDRIEIYLPVIADPATVKRRPVPPKSA